MADEQIPMEQEPSKSEPPETGAGYDDADEARQPASPPPQRTSRRILGPNLSALL